MCIDTCNYIAVIDCIYDSYNVYNASKNQPVSETVSVCVDDDYCFESQHFHNNERYDDR